MFERFTDKARRVIVLCQEEARRHNHQMIGTEHLLLALTHDGVGLGQDLLTAIHIDFGELRGQVLTRTGEGSAPALGHIPFTPDAKRALELSLREAIDQGVDYVATEHLLLGLLRSGEGIGPEVLADAGVVHETVRRLVAQATGAQFPETPLRMFRSGGTVYPTREAAQASGNDEVAEVTVELRMGEAFAVANPGGHFHSADFYLDYADAYKVYAEHRDIMDLEIVVMSPARAEVTALDTAGRSVRIGTVLEMAPLPLGMRTTPKENDR